MRPSSHWLYHSWRRKWHLFDSCPCDCIACWANVLSGWVPACPETWSSLFKAKRLCRQCWPSKHKELKRYWPVRAEDPCGRHGFTTSKNTPWTSRNSEVVSENCLVAMCCKGHRRIYQDMPPRVFTDYSTTGMSSFIPPWTKRCNLSFGCWLLYQYARSENFLQLHLPMWLQLWNPSFLVMGYNLRSWVTIDHRFYSHHQ